MIIQFDFGKVVTGVGYQFYDVDGVLIGNRITDGIVAGPQPGLYLADTTIPDNAIGVYWSSDQPGFSGFDPLEEEHELDELQSFVTAHIGPPPEVDFSGASPQFLLEPIGPFICCEPNAAGIGDVITVAVQGGIFSGMDFSGTNASIQQYGPADVNFQNPIILRNIIVDRIGNSNFRAVAEDLGSQECVIAVRYQNNPNYIGFTELEVDTFGKLSLFLDNMICAFRHIPRFEEPGRISEDGTRAIWGWGNWHIAPAPVLLKNTNTWLNRSITGAKYSIDYKNGTVFFERPFQSGQEVRASYEFRLLDLRTYQTYFQVALDMINSKKPQTSFDRNNYPAIYNAALLLYGYIMVCRTIIPKISTFRYRRLFENPDQLISSLESNIATATADFTAMLQGIKRRGLISPAAVSTFQIGRQNPWQVDEVNFQQFVVSRV